MVRKNDKPALFAGKLVFLMCLLLCAALFGTACGVIPEETMPETTAESVPETTEESAPETTQEFLVTDFVWPANTLRSDEVPFSHGRRSEWGAEAAAYPVLGSELLREQILSVTFLDTLSDAPDTAGDVSAGSDGSVLAWAKKNGELYDLFIAAEGGMDSTDSCNTLLAG